MVSIGVLALQGDFSEHVVALKKIGAEAREVRTPEDLAQVDALIIPGGESTVISRLMDRWGLRGPITERASQGMPAWGTCAGLILMAGRITDNSIRSLDLMDIDVQRNAYGRQTDSFETDLHIPILGNDPMHAVFIRAPIIRRMAPAVQVLAKLGDGTPVAIRQGNLIGSTFHPELTPDTRFHAYLVALAAEHARQNKPVVSATKSTSRVTNASAK